MELLDVLDHLPKDRMSMRGTGSPNARSAGGCTDF